MMYLPESVGYVTRTFLAAFQAIKPFWTHPFLAMNPSKSRVTHTCSIYMVTLCPILTVAFLSALKAIHPDGTLLLTPAKKYGRHNEVKC